MRVLISGGGIAGLTLALCLKRAGHEPVVIERAPGPRSEGYMIDFFGSGYDAAERLGLLEALGHIHYPIARLAFLKSDGRVKFAVPYPTIRRLFGGRHFNFMRGELESVLYDEIRDGVEVRFGTTIESLVQEEDHVAVSIGAADPEAFDLLVAADGVHSHVRSLVFGPESEFSRFLGYYTAAFVLDNRDLGRVAMDAFQTVTEPGRTVSVYPIRGRRLATFFIHRAAARLNSPLQSEAVDEMHRAYSHMGWIVPQLLARVAATDLYFDEVTQIEMPSWSQGRVVLVGDACQCVSLLAGQGASLAVAGAYILAEELAATPDDVLGALARYEVRLRPAILEKQAAGRQIAGWFVPEDRLHIELRDLALRMSGWPIMSQLVKRQFATTSVLSD